MDQFGTNPRTFILIDYPVLGCQSIDLRSLGNTLTSDLNTLHKHYKQ